MGFFDFLKKKKSQEENDFKNAMNTKVVEILSEKYPEVFSGIFSMINSGDNSKLVALPDVEKPVSSIEDSSQQSSFDSEKDEVDDYERAKQNAERSKEAIKGAKSTVETDFSGGVPETSAKESKSENDNTIRSTGGETKVMTEVIIPNDTGSSSVFMTWEDAEAQKFKEETQIDMLKKTAFTVGANPKDNPRAVLIGADLNVPEIRAYYEALKALGKVVVFENEVRRLETFDVFYFANSSEDFTDKQTDLAERAKNLYVIYFDEQKVQTLPFKRQFSVFVPFKKVEGYDSVRKRVDFLADFTGLVFSDDKLVQDVRYINQLSLLNNSSQKHQIEKVRKQNKESLVLTDYVYVDNYNEDIQFPLSKAVKSYDITVFSGRHEEIAVTGVRFERELSYYEAPVYMAKFERVMHFVSGGKAIIQTADVALLTYAEAQISVDVFSQRMPQMEAYLELISPKNEDAVLTKEELFERFGNGMLQLQEALK